MPLEITARARLHLGFLDLTGDPGRRYGGIGLSLASPRLRLTSGLAGLHGLESPPLRLAAMMGRGRRSGIGLHTFLGGGFVVDGGHPPATERAADDDERSRERCPPLLARHEIPESWRILV